MASVTGKVISLDDADDDDGVVPGSHKPRMAPSKVQAPACQRPSGGTTIDLTAGDADDAVAEVGGGGNSSRKRKSGGRDVIEIEDGSPAKSNRGGRVGVYEMFKGARGGGDVMKKGGRRGLEEARKAEEDEKLRLELQQARAKLQELEKLKDKPVQKEATPNFGECPICLCDITKPGTTKCGHLFCYDCIIDCITHKKICPTCRAKCQTSQVIKLFV